MPATNIPLKSHIYYTCPSYLTSISGGSMLVYMPHMDSLASTMSQKCCTHMKMTQADSDSMAQLHTLSWSLGQISQKPKILIKKDAFVKFYDETKTIYIETNASGVSLRAGMLQVRDTMNCTRYELPDNTLHRPTTAFAGKNLSNA